VCAHSLTGGYTCPVGKSLPYQRKHVLPEQTKYTYQAAQQDC
jgi:hypothetical protein